MMRRILTLIAFAICVLLVLAVGWMAGRAGIGPVFNVPPLTTLEQQFAQRMQGATMVGFFTIAGAEERERRPERYDISSVEKVGENLWRFNTRMRYGRVDVTLPVTVPLQWIDDTPVIMLTDYSIPTLGTFSVRVLFHGDRYAGTWQHGAVGGHMFGRVEKTAAGEQDK